jgi:hypothetical protein
MSEKTLATRGGPWVRLFDTNVAAAAAAFGTVVGKAKGSPPASNSTGLAIISPFSPLPVAGKLDFAAGEAMPNAVELRFFGRDAANETFLARVWGFTKGIGSPGGTATECWERVLLAQFTLTLGNIAGVAGTLIEASDFEVDTITLTYGASADVSISSPANDLPAKVRIDHQGYPILGIELDDNVSAAEVNALYRFLW